MPDPSQTLCGLFWNSVRLHGDRPAQEWHEGGAWASRTYAEFGRAVRDVAHALLAAGLKPGDRVALWSRNSPRWAEVDLACQTAGLVAVPIYETLTADKAAYILGDSGAKVLFIQDRAMAERFAPSRAQAKAVGAIVQMEGEPAAGTLGYGAFVAQGRAWGRDNPRKLDERAAKVGKDDLASLVYTSGTTGEPKGAMLTQGNFAVNATTAMGLVGVGPYDVFLSFLPLSHVFERTGGHFGAYFSGAKVVFARSVDTLMDDLQHAQPTLMMSVPRLYEKMHARILESVGQSSWLKRRIFHWAIQVGMEANAYRQRNEPLPKALEARVQRADRLVFHKLKARVGGRLRFFVSGGAALAKDIEEFFWAAGIAILQGYGLTETSPVTNVNRPGALRFGSVGKAIPGVEVRIDTSEWDSSGKARPEGEVCVQGPNVMQGYWNNPKATAEVFDKQGWFHTGDIGYVDEDGFLFITDRKKEIVVMSNGKKVAPQPIEGHLKLQPHIVQACVVGDARNYVAALIVPDFEALAKYAAANGIPAQDRARLVSDPRIVSLYEREVEAVNARLSRFEQVKKFWVMPDDWTVDSGELTPTLKLKRRVIHDRHKAAIQRLYPAEEKVEIAAR